jgi:DNA-binding LacI/PurR family transcriptional regulator
MYKTVRKKTRLADIATEAGVSTVTVAKALNHTGGKNARVGEATAKKIREIAARLKYKPDIIAQQLAGKKSGVIGVVMDSCAPQVYHELLSKMEMYASAKGYKFMIGQTHEDIEKIKAYAHEFSAYGAEGIICIAHAYPCASSEIAALYNSVAKTVFMENPDGSGNYCSVSINIRGSYQRAVEYLVGNGKKRIALLLIESLFAKESMDSRKSGYIEGLKNCGLSFDKEFIKRISVDSVMDEKSYLPIIKDLLYKQKADAILACNDRLAAMAMKILAKLKVRIPQDMAVIGYDNIDVASLITPSLTTFDQKNDEISKTIVNLLIKLIKEENISVEERNVIIEPLLIKRESA